MSFFKKISKVAAKTAFIGAIALGSGGPIVAAASVPLGIYIFAKEEFSERRNLVQVDEELFRQMLEARKDFVKTSYNLEKQILDIKEDVDHLYEII